MNPLDLPSPVTRYRRELWKVLDLDLVQGGDAAEIGVAEGNFSAEILKWPVRFPIVYMVDRWMNIPSAFGDSANSQGWHDKNFQRAKEQVRGFGDRTVILRGESIRMADYVPVCSLSLLYIDADHSYDGVMGDLRVWESKVILGGVVALHDYENEGYGVKKAVREFCQVRGYQIYLLPEDQPCDAGAYFF